RLTGRVEELERRYAARVREARGAADVLRSAGQKAQQDSETSAGAWAASRTGATAVLRKEAEELRERLKVQEARAGCDEHLLARQIAAETQRERLALERRFEETSKLLKEEHAQAMAQLRSERDTRLAEVRQELESKRLQQVAQAEEALAEAVQRQELSFQAERDNMEAAQERYSASLAEAREESHRAKDECEERQRVLDEMSRELQERKRQGQALAKEADTAHNRKLRHETEGRELRRKKASLERSLGRKPAPYGDGAAERAVASLSEDLRQVLAHLETTRGELALKKRSLQERRSLVEDREQRCLQLTEDLTSERNRSDEMQRVLLRLEQGL
ncbi:unnamed protein product, partial [Effrenium voratum]